MAGQKKFGAFEGVFTPSILTILGVIMYLRLGWVVGNAGLYGAILIVIIAHVISISTGLSISSISTDKKVGAGGVYYVLSRSLGLPIGGAIGLTLFVGTAFSIALYLVGFSESFNAYLGLDTSINGLRNTASLSLLVLTIIAFISTSVALKTQFFILAAIIISIVAIFTGTSDAIPETVPSFGGEEGLPLETVFAVFFPAVTGFTAGIAMSGDLKDPKRSIPAGTIASIAVGFVVYIALTIFLANTVSPDVLRSDNNIMMKIAFAAPAVVAGIWGATLSSAIGGILGGPRILQAMSIDRITPKLFGKGVGLGNEPRNALILTVLIAEAGILIGELDLIARVVSMFYLAAYGFINISFFLESWASTDFKPSFKVNKWIGFVGFVATFVIMFKLDMLAMIAAFVLIGGIYLWLQRKQITLGTGDVWQSVWSTVVKSGLKRMEAAVDHKRNWKPNIMLFSGNSEARPHLLEFSKALTGRAGMVTNFDLIENKDAQLLFPKHKQKVSDELLQKYDIFGRRIEVKNIYQGIETIATTFGFSGLDPNTILMGWARNTTDPIWFAQMTQKLIDLDYNVLYLDYDKRWGFRKKEQIDLWWRGISNNAELMLHLAKFMLVTHDWDHAKVRILLINDFNVDRKIIENRIQGLLDEFRVEAEIKIINNEVEKKPFYELMKIISAEADLIFIGVPDIKEGQEAIFVEKTNDLVGVIGTTLLVKASTTFEVTKLGLRDMEKKEDYQAAHSQELMPLQLPKESQIADAIRQLDMQWDVATLHFSNQTLAIIQQHYLQFIAELKDRIILLLNELKEEKSNNVEEEVAKTLKKAIQVSQKFNIEELDILANVLLEGVAAYRKERLDSMATTISVIEIGEGHNKTKIKWKKAVTYYQRAVAERSLHEMLRLLGAANAKLLFHSSKVIRSILKEIVIEVKNAEDLPMAFKNLGVKTEVEFKRLRKDVADLVHIPLFQLRTKDREICRELSTAATDTSFNKKIRTQKWNLKRKTVKKEILAAQQFAENWQRNQHLFHQNFDISLQLTQVIFELNSCQSKAINRLKNEYVNKINAQITKLQKTLEVVSEKMKNGEFEAISSETLHVEETDFDNTDNVLRELTDAIHAIPRQLPDEVVLMDELSFNNFSTHQGTEVATVNLSIAKITDFLMSSNFIAPFRKNLSMLRQQLRQMNGSVFNSSSLLVYGIESAKEEQNLVEFTNVLQKTSLDLEKDLATTNAVFSTFEAEIKDKYELTASLIDINNIITEADELSQYVRIESRRKGIMLWKDNAEKAVESRLRQLLDFIDRKKEDVASIAIEQANQALLSDRDILRNFIEKISVKPATAERLPFYYRQLFSGKHISLGKEPESRKREIAEVKKALQLLQSGIFGGIMVTGEALSGKSFFTDYVSQQLIGKKSLRIPAPVDGALAIKDMQQAFQQASGHKGTISSILRKIAPSTTIILDDIELWWLKAPSGSRIINTLVGIINQFSHRHTFLLNCGLNTLKLLRTHTNIDQGLIATVILTPLSREHLGQAIWVRHKTGGIQLRFEGVEEEQITEKMKRRLFTRIHNLSGGNIGLAMRIWLANLRPNTKGNMVIDYPQNLDFPALKDKEWHFLLLQLYLHKALSRKRLEKLFEGESKEWVTQKINEWHKAQILENQSKNVFVLKAALRPYLESWFKEREML